MMNTVDGPFISSTHCAKRWALELPETGPLLKGYIVELIGFGDLGFKFLAVVSYRAPNGDACVLASKLHLDHPVDLSIDDPELVLGNLLTTTYVNLRLPAKIQSDEDCAKEGEKLVGMIMHGRLGPHPGIAWEDRWAKFLHATKI